MMIKGDDPIRKKGIVLIIVLLVFIVFSVAGLVLFFLSTNQLNKMKVLEAETKSHYLAYSGVELAFDYVLESHDGSSTILYGTLSEDSQTDSFEILHRTPDSTSFEYIRNDIEENMNLFGDSNIIVAVYPIPGGFRFVSKGRVNDVEKIITVERNLFFGGMSLADLDYALFTVGEDNSLTLQGAKTTIAGDVGTNSDAYDYDDFEGVITGVFTPGLELEFILPDFPDYATNTDLTVTQHSSFTIDASSGYNDITVSESGILYIDTGTSTSNFISIVCNTMSLGSIHEVGASKAIFYLNEGFTFGGDGTLEGDITFISAGDVSINNTSGDALNLAVYAPNSEISLSGNSTITGSFVGDVINVGGNSIVSFKSVTDGLDFIDITDSQGDLLAIANIWSR